MRRTGVENEKKKWDRIKTSNRKKQASTPSPQASKKKFQQKINYVVTKDRAHSWLDDIYMCEPKNLDTRIYN